MTRVRAALPAVLVLLLVALSGCGTTDGNPQAARIVAQAYLDAYSSRNAAAICRLILPPLAVSFATQGGGSCERRLAPTLTPADGPFRTGKVDVVERNATVQVAGGSGRDVTLAKLGSIWRVSGSWLFK